MAADAVEIAFMSQVAVEALVAVALVAASSVDLVVAIRVKEDKRMIALHHSSCRFEPSVHVGHTSSIDRVVAVAWVMLRLCVLPDAGAQRPDMRVQGKTTVRCQ